MKFFGIILFFLASQFTEAQTLTCANLLKPSYLENPSVKLNKNSLEFHAVDHQNRFGDVNEPFFFKSYIDEGSVYIDSILRYEEKRSTNLSGHILFRDMLAHFNTDKVKKISGQWFSYSDNFTVFKQAVSKGFSPIEAAFMTWTGQQALIHGFNYVSVTIRLDESEGQSYTSIEAEFSKNKEDQSGNLKIAFE